MVCGALAGRGQAVAMLEQRVVGFKFSIYCTMRPCLRQNKTPALKNRLLRSLRITWKNKKAMAFWLRIRCSNRCC